MGGYSWNPLVHHRVIRSSCSLFKMALWIHLGCIGHFQAHPCPGASTSNLRMVVVKIVQTSGCFHQGYLHSDSELPELFSSLHHRGSFPQNSWDLSVSLFKTLKNSKAPEWWQLGRTRLPGWISTHHGYQPKYLPMDTCEGFFCISSASLNLQHPMRHPMGFMGIWLNPIGSMYAIYGNIYHQYTPNVSIYIYIPYMDPMGIWLENHRQVDIWEL